MCRVVIIIWDVTAYRVIGDRGGDVAVWKNGRAQGDASVLQAQALVGSVDSCVCCRGASMIHRELRGGQAVLQVYSALRGWAPTGRMHGGL